MRKNNTAFVLALTGSLFFPLSAGFADCPPDCSSHQFSIQSMALSYNSVTAILHVEADHHSRDQDGREVDYVNKMTVALNGNKIITLHFRHQMDPDTFSDDVMVKAKPGDVISVGLFSSGESTRSLDLTVSGEIVTETRSVDTQSSSATDY